MPGGEGMLAPVKMQSPVRDTNPWSKRFCWGRRGCGICSGFRLAAASGLFVKEPVTSSQPQRGPGQGWPPRNPHGGDIREREGMKKEG